MSRDKAAPDRPQDTREAKLAQALRANLRRRKAAPKVAEPLKKTDERSSD